MQAMNKMCPNPEVPNPAFSAEFSLEAVPVPPSLCPSLETDRHSLSLSLQCLLGSCIFYCPLTLHLPHWLTHWTGLILFLNISSPPSSGPSAWSQVAPWWVTVALSQIWVWHQLKYTARISVYLDCNRRVKIEYTLKSGVPHCSSVKWEVAMFILSISWGDENWVKIFFFNIFILTPWLQTWL